MAAQAGSHDTVKFMDSRLRGNDEMQSLSGCNRKVRHFPNLCKVANGKRDGFYHIKSSVSKRENQHEHILHNKMEPSWENCKLEFGVKEKAYCVRVKVWKRAVCLSFPPQATSRI